MYRVLMINPTYMSAMKIRRLLHWSDYDSSLVVELSDIDVASTIKKVKPDILLLCSELNYTDAEVCLNQAVTANWDLRVIVLHDGPEIPEFVLDPHVSSVIGHYSLSREALMEAMEKACNEVAAQQTSGKPVTSSAEPDSLARKIADYIAGEPEKIHYLLKLNTEQILNASQEKEIKEQIDKAGVPVKTFLGRNQYCMVSFPREDSLHYRIAVTIGLAQKLFHLLDKLGLKKEPVYISEAFGCENFLQKNQQFSDLQRYHYFCGTTDAYVSQTRINEERIKLTEEQCEELIQEMIYALISGDRLRMNQSLEHLYLSYLKKSFDHDLVSFCRERIGFFLTIIAGFIRYQEESQYMDPNMDTLESEYRSVKKQLRDIGNAYMLYNQKYSERRTNGGRAVLKVITIIHNEYMDMLTLDSVAERVHVSREYLSKLFKEVSGYNFNEYLNLVRIQKAQRILIAQPEVSMLEVSSKTGFLDAKSFCRVFKRITGKTPTMYKNEGKL